MILKHYGGFVKRSELISMTKTTKEGTTAYHIKETLIKLGFNAKGIQCNLSDIKKYNITLPLIASVTINNSYKHFVVIYEINFKHKYLIIGDPADKIKKMKYTEFSKIFNNVLITFYPIKSLPINKDISTIVFIKFLLKSQKKVLLNLFVLSIFITLFSIFTSFYTEYMINGINSSSKDYLLFTFCIFFSIYIIKIITDYFRNQLLIFINQSIDLKMTLDVFNKIVKLPYSYYQSRTTGDILSRINDLETLRDMISKVALSIFVDLPLTILSLFVLYLINTKLFLIGIIILICYLLLILIFRNVLNNYIKDIKQKRSESISHMIESISGFQTIKGSHLENSVIDRFERKYIKLLKNIELYEKKYCFQGFLKDLINNIGFVLITLYGCILVMNGKMTIGALLTFTTLLVYFLEPIKNIINLDNLIKESKISLKRILDIISYEIKDNGFVEDFVGGDIIFNNLSFSFNDRDYILKNLNLKIKDGSKNIVIGKSGSGKSTLFKILMKYYEISNNNIYINGIDLNNYKNITINSNIVYLSQNEILFNDTLYNNLLFYENKNKDLLEISKMCYIDEIIDSNLGYNMLIEENGANLSGGEKERIVLGRTLLNPFKILIIDEGLSQVDICLERKILKNIIGFFKDETIIFISHRLDNADLFDNLIKIENGAVVNA